MSVILIFTWYQVEHIKTFDFQTLGFENGGIFKKMLQTTNVNFAKNYFRQGSFQVCISMNCFEMYL